MTQSFQQSLCYYYSCECLVNSKIPTSLFTKLESRLRRHLQSQLPVGKFGNDNQTTGNNSDQLKLLEGDEVLAATIESLRITEDQKDSLNSADQLTDSSTEYSEFSNEATKNPAKIFKVFLYKYPELVSTAVNLTTTRTIDLNQSDHDPNSPDNPSNFYSIELFPCPSYQGLWESLEFDSNVKESCLAYLTAVFRFTMKGMTEQNEISFNRILLLHGPPGTGKSTLAKALVFKLSTRLYFLQSQHHSNKSSDYPRPYDRIICLTVHSNQLFSRFFSESSKSVQKLFERIRALAGESGNFVCVLIDEVESLAMSRKQSADSGSSEPTDSIRAVNTLLTQIDHLRSLPNVLYLTTSNYPALIDEAFVDRVDWSFEIGLPPERILYSLLVGCVRAMRLKGLVKGTDELASTAQAAQLIGGPSSDLLSICSSLKGQSGRAIKRLPLMAYAAHLQKFPNSNLITIPQFIQSLRSLL